mgnify:CR=1 FL=1
MKKKVLENIVKWIFLLCGIAAVGFVLCICLYLVISGVPAIREIGLWNFLFGETWNAPTNEFGILPFILTSIYGTAGALLLGVPLGLFTAVFLAKAAPPRIAAAARSCVALLAGIPSVVYGLVGMTVLVPFVQKTFSLSSGACLLTAILVLTVMILPYIVSVSETALRADKISTFVSLSFCRSVRSTVIPSAPGRFRSSKTRSYRSTPSSARALSPS